MRRKEDYIGGGNGNGHEREHYFWSCVHDLFQGYFSRGLMGLNRPNKIISDSDIRKIKLSC